YWPVVGDGAAETLKLPFRTPLLPFVALSVLFDKVSERLTGKASRTRDYWQHGGLGVVHAGEAVLASPAIVAAGVGKGAEMAWDQLRPIAEAMGFKVDRFDVIDKKDGEKASLRRQLWSYAAYGLLQAVLVPIRVAGIPFAFGSLAADKLAQ